MTLAINATHPEHPTRVCTVSHTRGKPALLWGVGGTHQADQALGHCRPTRKTLTSPHTANAYLDSSKTFSKSGSLVKKQTTPHPRELAQRAGGLVDARHTPSQAAQSRDDTWTS
ncbi:unnamed protein product [Prunus armeniaca]|nr:unnamed protein product [Prunus armeniaca]